jgi:hypothetical protein
MHLPAVCRSGRDVYMSLYVRLSACAQTVLGITAGYCM